MELSSLTNFFFFQAEDGIRDLTVTGVQTCALPISLGHNDFAPRGEETRYMALHVTLTGLRGLLAPPAVIAAYHGLEYLRAGLGRWALLLPVALIVAGAREFTAMDRQRTMTGQLQEKR